MFKALRLYISNQNLPKEQISFWVPPNPHELHGFLYHILSEEIILDIEAVACLNLILHDGDSACSLCFILGI